MSRTHVPLTQLDPSYAVADPTPTPGDPINGHWVENDGYVWLDVTNNAGTAQTITIHVTPQAALAYNVADTVQVLQPGDHYIFGAFPPSIFTLPPQPLGTQYIADGTHTGSSPIAATPGTANCMTFDVTSALLVLKAFRL